MELYFDDGTNPSDEIGRRFIDVSNEIIQAGRVYVRSTHLLDSVVLIS
jgi:hypothetical protein